jgi:hypothetical protein
MYVRAPSRRAPNHELRIVRPSAARNGRKILACVFRVFVATQRRRENASERNRFSVPLVGEKHPRCLLYAVSFRAAYTLSVFRRSAFDVV